MVQWLTWADWGELEVWMGSRYGHLQIATEVSAIPPRGNDLHWMTEEGVGQGWEVLGDALGGYVSGCRARRKAKHQ